jgi:hypothetical protein
MFKRTIFLVITTMIVLTIFIGPIAFSGGGSTQFLDGSWFVFANLTSIDGVPPLPLICTYSADLLGGNSGSVVCTQPRLSPDGIPIGEMNRHGDWVRIGNGEFSVTLVGLALTDEQIPFGTITSNGTLTISSDLQTIFGESSTTVADFDGNVLLVTTEALNGRRINAPM